MAQSQSNSAAAVETLHTNSSHRNDIIISNTSNSHSSVNVNINADDTNNDNNNDTSAHNQSDPNPTTTKLFQNLPASSVPPSAAKKQIELFQNIIERRTKQLSSFSLATHQFLYKSLTTTTLTSTGQGADNSALDTATDRKTAVPITCKQISDLLLYYPAISQDPILDVNQYISLITHLLTHNFHSSIDNRLSATSRTHCLHKVKYILHAIEIVNITHLQLQEEQEGQEKKELLYKKAREEKKKLVLQQEEKRKLRAQLHLQQQQHRQQQQQQHLQQQQQQQQHRQQPQQQRQKGIPSSINMGSLISTATGSNVNNNNIESSNNVNTNINSSNNNNNGKNATIIILDDDHDDDDAEQVPTSTTNSNINSNSNSNSNINQQLIHKKTTSTAATLAATSSTLAATLAATSSTLTATLAATSSTLAAASSTLAATISDPSSDKNQSKDTGTTTAEKEATTGTIAKPSASLLPLPLLPPMVPSNPCQLATIKSSKLNSFQPSTKIPPSQDYIPPFIPTPREHIQTPTMSKSQQTNLIFLQDVKFSNKNSINYTSSSSLFERPRCELKINTQYISCLDTLNLLKKQPIPPPPLLMKKITSSIYLDGHSLDNFESRLRKWDPYWNTICNCSTFEVLNGTGNPVEVGYKTTHVALGKFDHPLDGKLGEPRMATMIPIQFINLRKCQANILSSIRWERKPTNYVTSNPTQHVNYVDKERRIIVRTLPLIPNPKYKKIRSDTHLWPKGTFMQLDSRQVYPIFQRKQQQHDPSLWKGMSHIADITEYLSGDTISYNQKHNIPMNLTLCSKDGEMYGIQIALCEHVSPDALFDQCMASGEKSSIAKMNYQNGWKQSMKHFDKETLVLDSDDEDDDDDAVNGNKNNAIESVTISLICPVMMKVIQTPVRGKRCKHLNCFDLKTYLHSNANVSGGRWRCFVCEDFVPVDELVYDGFLAQVLETFSKDINTTTRSKVQLMNDGSWNLLDETTTSAMKRNQKKNLKRKIQEQGGTSKMMKNDNAPVITEIIDIDD